jgi:hypothetical protein
VDHIGLIEGGHSGVEWCLWHQLREWPENVNDVLTRFVGSGDDERGGNGSGRGGREMDAWARRQLDADVKGREERDSEQESESER